MNTQDLPMPQVLILGDSIALQYTPYVEQAAMNFILQSYGDHRRALENLDFPRGPNSGDSFRVLQIIEQLKQANRLTADLVLLNCGLHDIKHETPDGPTQVTIIQYEKNLEAIIALLRQSNCRVAWVETTPINDEVHNMLNGIKGFHRFNADVLRFNEIAQKTMNRLQIPQISLLGAMGISNPSQQDQFDTLFCDHAHFKDEIRLRQAIYLTGWIECHLMKPA